MIGGPYVSPEERLQQPVEIVFCNPDLLWRSDFERPRLGQGAFKEAFQAVFKAGRRNVLRIAHNIIIHLQAVTGSPYPYVQYGKPTHATYNFAESVLTERLKEMYGISDTLPNM